MAEEKYRIVVWLSHRRISLFYSQGGGQLQPFPGGDWPEPLALLPGENGVTLGAEAVRAKAAGNACAIADYFTELQRDRLVRVGASDVPLRQLLLLALEDRFRDVLQSVFFNSYGNLEANRSEMPLLLLLAPNIRDNERNYLCNLFLVAGYHRVECHDMDSMAATCLLPSAKPMLMADSDGQDLHLTLRPANGDCKRLSIAGAGVDPRVEDVANKIWEDASNDIVDGHTQKMKDQEWDNVRRAAIDFLRSDENSRSGLLTVSSGDSANYYVRKPSVFATDTPQTAHIRATVENFLSENGVDDKGEGILLLWGDAAANGYFRALLSPGFTAVHEQNQELKTRVRNYLATTVIGDTPIASPGPGNGGPTSGGGGTTPPPPPPPPPPTPGEEWTDKEKRRLRVLVVQTEGSRRIGNRDRVSTRLADMRRLAHGRPWPDQYADAIADLEQFARDTSTPRGPHTPPAAPKPPQPTPPQPKPEWTAEELKELRLALAAAEGALRAGNKAKAAELLADLRRLRGLRQWPEGRQRPNAPTWRQRIEKIEQETK